MHKFTKVVQVTLYPHHIKIEFKSLLVQKTGGSHKSSALVEKHEAFLFGAPSGKEVSEEGTNDIQQNLLGDKFHPRLLLVPLRTSQV